MRVVDCFSSPSNPMYKHLLVEDRGEFAVLGQVQGRNAAASEDHLSEEVAFVVWRKLLMAAFYAVSHNPSDSTRMAERRLQTLH